MQNEITLKYAKIESQPYTSNTLLKPARKLINLTRILLI